LISPQTTRGGSTVTANVELTGIPRLRGRRRRRRDRIIIVALAFVLAGATMATCAAAWNHRSVVTTLVIHPAAAAPPKAAAFDPFGFSMIWLGMRAQPALPVRAQAVYLVDMDSRIVLWARDPETSRAPARLAKLMTAIVAFDDAGSLDRVVTVPAYVQHIEPSLMGVTPGEKLTVRE